MAFYLIGLGLNTKSISLEGLERAKKSKEIYLENYTVDFPYKKEELEKLIGQKIIELGREKVEKEEFLEKAKRQEISLLVYGDCLSATTHISLIEKCIKEKIKFQIIHAESILNAISNTGLQLYKFGKTASMPAWRENWKPDSFIDYVKENKSIDAHTLLLVDIGLEFNKAREELEEAGKNKNISFDKIIVCSCLGTQKEKIIYQNIKNIKKVEKPYCIIIPAKMHFLEEESLKMIVRNK